MRLSTLPVVTMDTALSSRKKEVEGLKWSFGFVVRVINLPGD